MERTPEAYGKHYAVGYPHAEYGSGRPRLISPLYQRLKDRSAVFSSKLGWERANWFAPQGTRAEDVYATGRQNWFDQVGREHEHVREKAGLFDQSSFAKFELTGGDPAMVLEWICANRLPKQDGRLVYTQLLNQRGGIECDLTVTRLADDRFYNVTGTGFRTHGGAWIAERIPASTDARLSDVTEDRATLSLMGPSSREILQATAECDCSNAAFPFGHARALQIGGADVLALRLTYVGELGWELHMPMGDAAAVFDALMQAGEPHDLQPAGYRAIESLRLEKGYRAWGADITPNDSPFEAGLGWAVKLNSGVDFLGREAAEEAAQRVPLKRLAGFTLDDPDVVLIGRETILRNGELVGYLTSGGFGYTIGKPVGYGYVRSRSGVDPGFLESGTYGLVIAQDRFPASLHLAFIRSAKPPGARLKPQQKKPPRGRGGKTGIR